MKRLLPASALVKVTLVVTLLVATAYGASRLQAPKGQARIARAVADMVEDYHLSRKRVDDDVSVQLLERYLKALDPLKLYLTREDVEKMRQHSKTLDDEIKQGDISFAFDAFDVFSKRLEERVKLADKLIEAKHDFTVDEEIVVDPKSLDWSTAEELDERWRKKIKYELLTLKLGSLKEGSPDARIENPDAQPAEDLESAKERLHKRYKNTATMTEQTEPEQVLEWFLTALTTTFDPHSSYMSPSTLIEFQIQMRLKLQGIGAALRVVDGYTTVAEIVPGGAAAADARLKEGDKIVGVGQGEDGEIVDVVEMKLSKVVKMIRGPKDTVVRLHVQPADGSETKIYNLTRQVIELSSSAVRGEIIDSDTMIKGRPGRIGIINIPSFYRDFDGAQNGTEGFSSTARDVAKVLKSFAEQGGVDAIIIDLRNNGGGALVEAIDVTGLFIDYGPVVQVKSSEGRVKVLQDEDLGMAYRGPLVVVTNRLSASASEIFAGAIKDYHRGIIVGDHTTHGKGTVQSVHSVSSQPFRLGNPQPDGGALKVTINQFYRVNGESTQNLGVVSDVALPSLIDHFDIGESFLDNALEFDKVEEAKYNTVRAVTPEIISTLQNRSKNRVAVDKDFQKSVAAIERYLKRKNRKTVSLNEEVLRKEREEEKQEEDEKDQKMEDDKEKKADEEAGRFASNKPIFPDEYYNKEVLAITLDYVDLLTKRGTAGIQK